MRLVRRRQEGGTAGRPHLGPRARPQPAARSRHSQAAGRPAAPVVNPDWPQAGGYPNHAMYHLALPSGLKRVWTADVGDGSSRYRRVMSQPVVDGGVVYAMDGGVQVSAFDARDGRRKWRVDLKPEDERGNAFGGGPAFWNNRLFVATGYAQVVALDPGSGKVIWRRGVGAPVHAPPTVSDGRVFAVTVENELVTL